MIAKERYGTALTRPLLDNIQRGTMRYTYRGVPTNKNPFDWALYPMLLWEIKPAAIIEVGSNRGGSAFWMADMLHGFSIPCHIHSVDVHRVADLSIPGVTFHKGDGRRLEDTFSADFMRSVPRPLLVIEDADHQMQTTIAVLRFFDQWLKPQEYFLVEDGIVSAMGEAPRYDGGPHAAIEQFLQERGSDYEIDSRYCDWFGLNVTWNVNGFIRRKAAGR